MNKLLLIMTVGSFLTLMTVQVKAQPVAEPHELEITFNKTTSLIFSTVIKSVDRGSRDLLAQKAKELENVLHLKAARPGFPATNLTVITADGGIHQFAVSYAKEPACLVLDLNSGEEGAVKPGPKLIFQTEMTESDMENYASSIVASKQQTRFHSNGQYKMNLSLRGIYIKDNVIFYHFHIANKSNINYNVEYLRFYVQDKAKVRRTASQEVDVKPLYVFGDDKAITGKATNEVVYALEKFTIPDAKRLVIELFEHNGGRNLNLSIKNKTIVNAKLIQ